MLTLRAKGLSPSCALAGLCAIHRPLTRAVHGWLGFANGARSQGSAVLLVPSAEIEVKVSHVAAGVREHGNLRAISEGAHSSVQASAPTVLFVPSVR